MLNVEKIGMPIAKIIDGKYDGQIIYLNTNENVTIRKSFNKLRLDTGKFQQLPNFNTERNIWYITGPSGSGKSTYTNSVANEWRTGRKANQDIYIFSALKEDPSLDKLKPKRIVIDDDLVNEPFGAEDFENSLVIFDDIDVISNKAHREAVFKVLNEILEIGRHNNVSCIITNHLPTGGKDTRRVLNESHYIVYFPHSGSKKQINYLLTEYIGLDRHEITAIKKSKSRWACVSKNYPMYVLTEKTLRLLSADDDDE